jgi:hypothetical protein
METSNKSRINQDSSTNTTLSEIKFLSFCNIKNRVVVITPAFISSPLSINIVCETLSADLPIQLSHVSETFLNFCLDC